MKPFWWMQGPLFKEEDEGGSGGGNTEESEDATEDAEEEASDEEETTDDEEEELTEEELKNAKGLFKLLKDPDTRTTVLRTMAEKAGVLKDPPTTKKEEAKAVRDVSDVLKESLGPEYFALFGDRLSKGLKELFAQEREETSKNVETMSARQNEQDVDRAFERLDRETKGDSKKFRQQMTALADRILPADGVSNYEYMKILYQVASGDKKASTASRQIADKINRNRSDVADRTHQLASGAGKNKAGGAGDPPKGLKNIVEQAISSLSGKK